MSGILISSIQSIFYFLLTAYIILRFFSKFNRINAISEPHRKFYKQVASSEIVDNKKSEISTTVPPKREVKIHATFSQNESSHREMYEPLLNDKTYSWYETIETNLTVQFPNIDLSSHGVYGKNISGSTRSFLSAYRFHYPPFPESECPFGQVKFNASCRPWLGCDELAAHDPEMNQKPDDKKKSEFSRGCFKTVYKIEIANQTMALSVLKYSDSYSLYMFNQGIYTMLFLQPYYNYVSKVYGFCLSDTRNYLLTELAENHWPRHIQKISNKPLNHILDYILSYVDLFKFIQLSPIGTGQVCDTRALGKMQGQFLVKNNRLILNDLDSWETTDGVQPLCSVNKVKKEGQPYYARWDGIDMDGFESPEGQARQNKSVTNKSDIWKMTYFLPGMFQHKDETKNKTLQEIYTKVQPMIVKMRSRYKADRPDIYTVFQFFQSVIDEYRV